MVKLHAEVILYHNIVNLTNTSRIITCLRKGGDKVVCKYERMVLKDLCGRQQSHKETKDTGIIIFNIQ